MGQAKVRLTRRGRDLMAWLRHWEIASKLAVKASGTPFSESVARQEKETLELLRRQIRSRYRVRS